jgi:hypothetical protein
MTADWPFGTDADRDDPLTALRVPVTGTFPGWKYVACFDRESEVRPTDGEARMLASFIQEYLHQWFNERYIAKLAERALDVDSCNNTVIFHKWAEDDWSYRLWSWQYGPFWVPVAPRLRGGEYDYPKCAGPLSLLQVMDRKHTIGDEPLSHWSEWKAAHADIFPAAHPDATARATAHDTHPEGTRQ